MGEGRTCCCWQGRGNYGLAWLHTSAHPCGRVCSVAAPPTVQGVSPTAMCALNCLRAAAALPPTDGEAAAGCDSGSHGLASLHLSKESDLLLERSQELFRWVTAGEFESGAGAGVGSEWIGSKQEQKSAPRTCGCCHSDIRGSGVPHGLLSTVLSQEQALPAPVVRLSLSSVAAVLSVKYSAISLCGAGLSVT